MTEWVGRDYFRHSSLQQHLAEEQLARLTLAGAERILDVGCGDGKITAEIAQRVPNGSMLGTDPSQSMIAFASRQFAQAGHANLRFEVADVRTLPYRAEFDWVVSFNALHWVPEQETALRSLRLALKPGGRALLRLVPQGARKCLEDVLEDVRHEGRWAPTFASFVKPYIHLSPEQYRALAERTGFQVDDIRVEDDAWDFRTREGFLAFCRATCIEWAGCLPESDRDSFLTEVLDRYRTIAADNEQEANFFKFYQMEAWLRVPDANTR